MTIGTAAAAAATATATVHMPTNQIRNPGEEKAARIVVESTLLAATFGFNPSLRVHREI